MIGTIIGDIAGSKYESWSKHPKRPVQTKNFGLFYPQSRFTDDTVLTCATADALMNNSLNNISKNMAETFASHYKLWGTKYPDRGYGSGFRKWLSEPWGTTNNSFANGSMMRCSPIALYYPSLPAVEWVAKQSVQYTHNSPESVRGVQSIVSAIYMAAHGFSKLEIKDHVEEYYGHMLNASIEELRNQPKTTIRCNFTAPQALTCFMDSYDYESAIRNAIYIGGDTDTNAAIAGALAEAFYGTSTIPKEFIEKAKLRLTPEIIDLINKFYIIIGNSFRL